MSGQLEFRAYDKEGLNLLVSNHSAPQESRLYYEAHVTVPPLSAEQQAEVDQLCAAADWRRSTFELHKDGLVPNAFVSARDSSKLSIVRRVAEMCAALRAAGLPILRWKVEDTLLDSNRGDFLVAGDQEF